MGASSQKLTEKHLIKRMKKKKIKKKKKKKKKKKGFIPMISKSFLPKKRP